MKSNVDPPEMAAKERSTVLAGKENRKKPVAIQEFNIQPCGMPC